MSVDELIAQQQKRIELLERIVAGDSIRMDVIELELAMHRSQAVREKSAIDYAEQAVASEFNLAVRDFWRKPGGAGRPKGNVLPEYRQAQLVLFSFLAHVVGYSVEELRTRYGKGVVTYSRDWIELYNLVHKTRDVLLTKTDAIFRQRDLTTWDTYAPRYKGAYERWKTTMQKDGVWPDEYENELLTTETLEYAT